MLDRILTIEEDSTPTYWYAGDCPHTGELLQLPRTKGVEQIARNLMVELTRDERYNREGKMYGVLLVEQNPGEYYSIKAFSGSLNGAAVVDGWVPPIPGRNTIAIAEAATLEQLAQMKQELIDLDGSVDREQYSRLAAEFADKLTQLSIEHRQRKDVRQQQRERYESQLDEPELTAALAQLTQASCQDGRERRQLKAERDAILQPLQAILDRTDDRIRTVKQQRKMISRQLQTQMHEAYQLLNFLGTSSSLRELMPGGIPTGTGDCCAPKLLHYAASQGLKPLAMAEFWWGSGLGDGETGGLGEGETGGLGDWGTGGKVQGEFYGACLERCQPLMGFMLGGVGLGERGKGKGEREMVRLSLTNQGKGVRGCEIIYEDEYLIAIDKPAGLLSVPGRSFDRQDSALTRLRALYPDLCVVHRLDRDTSGILLLARDRQTYQHLSQQFATRKLQKTYEAILGGKVDLTKITDLLGAFAVNSQLEGSIDLPLSGNPLDRPRQQVDFKLGKPSLTKFQVLAQIDDYTRIEFIPVTGRTHQLRVHAADARGLGVTILGDRLYGCQANVQRLHLHARELTFTHPHTLEPISLKIQCPF